MILQDVFRDNGYTNLLDGYAYSKREECTQEYGFFLEDFFDSETELPKELLGIFISKQRDDLFFLLEGDSDVNKLCHDWDNQIRVFTMMNGRSKEVQKLQYNIVQLIVYSGEEPNRTIESNLLMSRKIIIKGNWDNRDCIEISDEEAVELPFCMIPANVVVPDREQTHRLHQLLPQEEDLIDLLKKPREKVKRKSHIDVQPKYYTKQEFDKIEEWLEK